MNFNYNTYEEIDKYIIIKVMKGKDKYKILKAAGENITSHLQKSQ